MTREIKNGLQDTSQISAVIADGKVVPQTESSSSKLGESRGNSSSESDVFEEFNSVWRNVFWPIRSHELSKFVPMAALMFCVLFNQNILRILKDSILISEVSAEITTFTKIYFVTPLAMLFVVVYAKMVNHLSFEKIFYYLISIFTIFYIIFAFLIYPNVDLFHMHPDKLELLMHKHPHLKWYIALFANWSYIIFYSLAELWPNIFYILLFWQFANEITTTGEAKRFYTLFSLFGNSSLVLVGFLMMNLASEQSVLANLFLVSNSKVFFTKVSMSMVAVSSVVSVLLVRYIAKSIMRKETKDLSHYKKGAEGGITKLGVIQSFKYIAQSRYLWLMLVCSASFGLSMNLVEAVWKAKIKELYPTVNGYAAYNSLYILLTGVVIMVMTIIGSNILRRRSWFAAAVITPIIILVTGVMFFTFVVFDESISMFLTGIVVASPLALSVFFGMVQNILSKGSKYSIWDTARQMLYIPLDHELKTKGKAAVDVISPKIGKSSSGFVISIVLTIFPSATLTSIAPLLMIVFVAISIGWIYAVRKIYFEYKKII